jgi:hypothetical protein
MSQQAIRAALEKAVAAMTPAVITAWENVAFAPPAATVPYQAVVVMFAEPNNPEYGRSYQELGVLNIGLFFPLQAGAGAAAARAEALRNVFYRGASFTDSGIIVNVVGTPTLGQGRVDGDRWHLPCKVQFSAFIS